MGTRYVINVRHEYYDMNECDARGYPEKKWESHSTSYESNKEPEVGDSQLIRKNGKLYERIVRSVHFNGCVYEDTESYDVEYYTREIQPDKFIIDKKWVKNKSSQEPKFGVLNGRNKIVVPYEYDEIETMAEGVFKVRKGKKWWIIDCKDGSIKKLSKHNILKLSKQSK